MGHRGGIDDATAIAGDAIDGNSTLLHEKSQRPEHRIVVHDAGDHMIAGSQQAMQDQIQRFRAIGGEYDSLRFLAPNQAHESLPCRTDSALHVIRFPIGASTGSGPQLTLIVIHGGVNRLRFGPTGGRVIEINATLIHAERW